MGSEEDKVVIDSAGQPQESGHVRTIFVFTDLPKHLEYRVGSMALLQEGTEIEFDLSLKNPSDPGKFRKVSGPYVVSRRILRYSTSRAGMMGLTQFLELTPAPR
jgi:hypothetical protein